MKNLNKKIDAIDRGAEVLAEVIEESSSAMPAERMHIIDRLNGILADVKEVAECLRQKGVPDEEMLDLV